MRRDVLLCAIGFCLATTVSPCSAAALKRVASIDVPGPLGQRFDYLTVDETGHRVFSAHLGPGILYVIDTQTNTVVKAIAGVPGITGLEYVPDQHKVYTSNWGEEKIGVVDLRTMTVVKRLPTQSKPNGIAYARPFGKVYVVNTLGKAVSIIDVRNDNTVKVIRFNSETGSPCYDAVSKRIYVTLRSTNEIAEIDPLTDTVVARYPVEGCRFNHGLAIDSEHHRALMLCGGTRNLTVFALDTHKTVAHVPLPAGADVIKFDAGLARAYAACSSGAISVVQEDDPEHFRKIEDFPVEKLVHSLAVDSVTHRVYAPEQQEGGRPAARIVVYEVIKN